MVKLPDNGKFVAGAGSDLQIYHDGSNSIIADSGTGELRLDSNTLRIRNAAGSETSAVFVEDGACQFRFDNSLKLETTSTGSKTTGMHLISGESNIDSQGNPLLFLQSTANTSIKAVFLLEDDYTTGRAALAINVGEAGVTNDRDLMLQKAGGKVGIRCTPTESFEVSGTSKFNGNITGDDNIKIKLGTGDDLQIYHDGTNSIINNSTGNLQVIAANQFRGRAQGYVFNSYDDQEGIIKGFQNGAVELYYDGSKKLETNTNGVNIFGRLLLGDSSGVNDNRIRLGADGDLSIYHDGSDSVIKDAGTGRLSIQTSHLQVANAANSETILNAFENGAVELYYDNSKKLETISNGAKVTGQLETTGDIVCGAELNFMGSSDNSKYIDCRVGSNALIIRKTTGGDASHETMAKFFGDGGVELYYDNSKKFETTSYGGIFGNETSTASASPVRLSLGGTHHSSAGGVPKLSVWTNGTEHMGFGVSGNQLDVILTQDNYDFVVYGGSSGTTERFRVYGDSTGIQLPDSSKALFGASNDLQIYHDGSNSYIAEVGTGNLQIQSANTTEIESDTGEKCARFHPEGEVQLYFDNSVKFATTSTGVSFANGADQTTSKLILALGNASTKEATIQGTSASTNEKGITFKTFSFAAKDAMTITPAGLVGIGTNSPSSTLEVRASTATHQLVSINRENSDTGALFLGCNASSQPMIAGNNADIIFGRDLSNSFTERMRLRPDGKLLINRSGVDGSGMLQVAVSGVGITTATGSQSSTTHLEFRNQSGTVGTIKQVAITHHLIQVLIIV